MKIQNSEVSMGLWNLSTASFHKTLSPREGKNLIKAAYRNGIRIFDTAYSYGNASAILSSALRELKRDDIKIISKAMPVPTIEKKAEAELKRLGRNQIDILLLHWPTEEKQLTLCLEYLSGLKSNGTVKDIGVSNFPISLLKWVMERFPISYHERPLSLIWSKDWEEEKSLGLKTIAYSPLGMGLLSGNYKNKDGISDKRKTLPMIYSPAFQEILDAIYHKPDIALSWVYGENPWCVVSGFSNPEQINLLQSIKPLDDSERMHLTALSEKLNESIREDNIFAHHWR